VSSLRPLATIALLAAVGVFLYMKINESEPKLSPEMEEISTMTLDVGGGDGITSPPLTMGVTAATPPALSGGDQAPPFSAVSVNPLAAKPAATSAAAPAGDAAPPWTPGPLAVGGGTSAPAAAAATKTVSASTPTSGVESSPVARSADPAAVPEMPPLPGAPAKSESAATTTPSVDGVAAAAVGAAAVGTAAAGAASGDDSAVTPTPVGKPETTPAPAASSMFAAARVAVQGALDRGEFAQALLLLSDWYGDPSLSPDETKEVNDLLAQLAGSVIYDGSAHRLEPPYIVQAGDTLESIAAKHNVPWQLLAKINGISTAGPLPPGETLKVVKGPFSAVVELGKRKMTLMLDRRYAGQFPLEIDPTASLEEGEWKVDQKLLTPAGGGVYGAPASEDRSLLLANLANPGAPAAIVRGSGSADPVSPEPRGRVLRLKDNDVADVFDILSEGSRVTIRR
jgi:LysM repeat protein